MSQCDGSTTREMVYTAYNGGDVDDGSRGRRRGFSIALNKVSSERLRCVENALEVDIKHPERVGGSEAVCQLEQVDGSL